MIGIQSHFGPFTGNSGYTGLFMHIIAYKYDICALYLLLLVCNQVIEVSVSITNHSVTFWGVRGAKYKHGSSSMEISVNPPTWSAAS